MAKDIRGLGRVSVSNVIDTSATGNPITTFAENIRGGGMANYNDSEIAALDGRYIDNNMIIYNTTQGYYEVYTGGTRNASGFMSGGDWAQLRFSGGAIDSDDSDARRNHTTAIILGRGLGFSTRAGDDSDLEIIANNVRRYRSVSDRNAADVFWSRGDVALVQGLEYFTNITANRGTSVGWQSNGNANQVVIFGVASQAEHDTIVASGALATTTEGANRVGILSSGGYVTNDGILSGQTNGQARLTLDTDVDYTSPNDLCYLTENAGINGGTYYFTQSTDHEGTTINSQWLREEEDDQLRILFNQADSEIRSLVGEHRSDFLLLQQSLVFERNNRAESDSELQFQLDEQSTRDTEIVTAYEAADTALGTRIDDAITNRKNRDSELQQEITDILHGHTRLIQGEHMRAGYGILLTRTDSDSDTINVDSERLDSDFRLASRNLLNYESVFVSGSQDTERITISGNLNMAAPRNSFTSATIGRGRFPDLSRIGGLPLYGIVTESLIDINGTYIRDPRSNKVLRITDDRGQSTDHVAGSVNPNPGTGATVVESVQAFYSYWQPGGGGLEEGLSLVATNDRGFISGNSTLVIQTIQNSRLTGVLFAVAGMTIHSSKSVRTSVVYLTVDPH